MSIEKYTTMSNVFIFLYKKLQRNGKIYNNMKHSKKLNGRKENMQEKKESINIKEICNNIATHLDEDSEYIEGISNLIFSEILNEVTQGKRVRIPHFGFFSLKKHKSRKSVLENLKDKEVPDFAKLNFEASEYIKKEITDKFRNGEAKTFK